MLALMDTLVHDFFSALVLDCGLIRRALTAASASANHTSRPITGHLRIRDRGLLLVRSQSPRGFSWPLISDELVPCPANQPLQ